MQVALRTKIQELEAAEAEEKEMMRATKKTVRDVQKVLSSKELSLAEKLDIFQQKFIERVGSVFWYRMVERGEGFGVVR